MERLSTLFSDRITWMAMLVVACFVAVLLLSSQSAASYPTYFLAIVVLVFASAWRDVFRVDLARWILALLIWLCISVFWSDPFEWREAASVWVRGLLVFTFVVAFAECQLRGQVQRWMAMGLAVVGMVAVVAAIVVFVVEQPADGRLNGLGQLDAHVIAALIFGVVMLFSLQIALTQSSVVLRLFAVALVAVIGVAVYLSDSRNAWVSVSFGAVVLLLAYKVRDTRAFLATLLSAALIFGVVVLVAGLSEAGREVLFPRGDSFRLAIWGTAIERIADGNLFTGLGILTSDDITFDNTLLLHPHNLYLAVVYQGGLVALVLYLGVLLLTVRTLLAHYESPDAKLALGILAIALPSHLLDGHELVDKVGETWFLIWLPVGIALGLRWHGWIRRES